MCSKKNLIMGISELIEASTANAKDTKLGLWNDIISLDQVGDFEKGLKYATIRPPHDLYNWDANLIVDYIEANHHQIAKDHAVDILSLGQTLVYEYGSEYPETRELTVELFLFLHDYLNCIRKEEEILFPKIKYLFHNKMDSRSVDSSSLALISKYITMIREEQQRIYDKLRSIHLITNDYSLPENACFPYRHLFEKMKEFEANFLFHVYLEGRSLFPKVLSKY